MYDTRRGSTCTDILVVRLPASTTISIAYVTCARNVCDGLPGVSRHRPITGDGCVFKPCLHACRDRAHSAELPPDQMSDWISEVTTDAGGQAESATASGIVHASFRCSFQRQHRYGNAVELPVAAAWKRIGPHLGGPAGTIFEFLDRPWIVIQRRDLQVVVG